MKLLFKNLFVVILCFLAFNLQAQQPLQKKIISKQDFRITPAQVSRVAQKAKARGIKPGEFKNVSYTYSDKVEVLSTSDKTQILSKIGDDGIIKGKDSKLSSDKIYVDEKSDLVFQSSTISANEYVMYQPSFDEVFTDFNLPLQTVPLNLANTSYSASGTTVSDRQTGANFDMQMDFDNESFEYEDEIEIDNTKQKIKVKITLDGYIGFNSPTVEARYTKNNGYKLVFKADEKVDLKIESDVEVSSLTRIPIWEFKIPAKNIAECKVGVFIVVDINGKINLEAEINQGIDFEAGVEGKTFFYVPRSVSTINETTSYCNVDYKISGEIKAFGGVECVADFKVKGYDILRLRGKGGMEVNVKKSEDQKDFEANVGFRVILDGKVKKIDKNFTLIDKLFILWEKKEKNFGGYTLLVKDADAYFDRVHGVIFKTADSTAYKGNITLNVLHNNNQKTEYQGNTNDNGVFAMTNIPLKLGDRVSVKIADSPNPSTAIDVDIPFKEITLNYADYYTNKVEGVISAKINHFPNITQTPNNVSNVNPNIVNTTINPNIKHFEPNIKLDLKKFKNAILVYNGDIQIIKESTVFQAELTPIKTNKKLNQKNIKQKVGINQKVNVTQKAQKNIPKALQQKPELIKVQNKPFGAFTVSNIDIKPMQRVKARINIDGFIVESPWIYSEGLIFSEFYDENKNGSYQTPEISADNSWLFVSALRSEKAPTGEITLLRGIDMKHSSPYKNIPTQQVEEVSLDKFPKAKHPIVYFNKNVGLQPNYSIQKTIKTSDLKGIAIAQTGSWSVNNIYCNPKIPITINEKHGHLFEYIGYKFEGSLIRYKTYEEVCPSCGKSYHDKMQDVQNNKLNQKLQNEVKDISF